VADPLAIADAAARAHAHLAQLEAGTVRELLPPLTGALDDAVAQLAALGLSTFQRARLNAQVEELTGALTAAYHRLGLALPQHLLDLGAVVAPFHAQLASAAIGVSFDALPLAAIEQLITGPIGGRVLGESLARQRTDVVNALRTSVTSSLINGDGMPAAARRFRAAADVAQSSAESLVRTSIMFASNKVATETYRAAGADVAWLSTLDSKTCVICGPRDGQLLAEIGGQHPPAHPRCRCTVIPRTGLFEALGPQTTRTRSSEFGTVETSGYDSWFKRQSAAFQQDVLGPSRYRLFKQGRLPLGAFAPGDEILSLSELQVRHAAIFEDVGLAH
jgi:SPP1 gp7 family putative phage head morphogenesis protein